MVVWWWLDAEHLKEVYGGLSSSRPQAEAIVEEPSEYGQDSVKKNGIIWMEFDGCWMLPFAVSCFFPGAECPHSTGTLRESGVPLAILSYFSNASCELASSYLVRSRIPTELRLFSTMEIPVQTCQASYIGVIWITVYRDMIWYGIWHGISNISHLRSHYSISQVIPRTCICLAASKCRSLSTRWKHGVARFFWKHVWHISGLYLKPPLRPPRHGASKALCWGLEPIRGDFDPVLVGTPARWTGGSRLQTLTKRHRHFKHDRNLLHPCSSYLKSVVWCYDVICGVSTWVVWCGYITELNKAPAVSGLCFLQLAWKGRVKGRKILRRCSSKCHSSMMGQPMQLTSFCQSEHGGEECWDW